LIFSIAFQPALAPVVLGIFIHISSHIFHLIFKQHSPKEDNKDEKEN